MDKQFLERKAAPTKLSAGSSFTSVYSLESNDYKPVKTIDTVEDPATIRI